LKISSSARRRKSASLTMKGTEAARVRILNLVSLLLQGGLDGREGEEGEEAGCEGEGQEEGQEVVVLRALLERGEVPRGTSLRRFRPARGAAPLAMLRP
jgi:hypothetical protein